MEEYVMTTTLILDIEKSVLEQAKSYAEGRHMDLSRLIGDYLLSLPKTAAKYRINPLVESLTGVIPESNTVDYRQGYREYLENKY
jgi:hypothetical protein